MKRKQIITILLFATLILMSVFPTFAAQLMPMENESEEPTLSAKIVAEGSEPGLYITLSNLPKEVDRIVLNYSFNGEDYFLRPAGEWLAADLESMDDCVTLLAAGLDEYPMYGYQSKQVQNLFLQVQIFSQGDLAFPQVTNSFQFSHDAAYEIPQAAPPFSVDVKFGWWTYSLYGRFSDFPPNVDRVFVTYSWDGVDFQSSNPYGQTEWFLQNLGHPDLVEREKLEYQEIGTYMNEPLKSFMSFERDVFYMRLEIHTLDGKMYYSQPAKYTREGIQPLPEHLVPRIEMGFNVSVSEWQYENGAEPDTDSNYPPSTEYTHGQYQMTVPEDATPAEIEEKLPESLPVRVFIWDKYTKEKYAYVDMDCKVEWKQIPSQSLKAGEPTTIADAANPLVIPAGTNIETMLGTYTLQKPLSFKSLYDSDSIQLILNPVAAETPPEIVLRACDRELLAKGEDEYYQQEGDGTAIIDEWTPLSIIFMKKPTQATAIHTYAVVGNERFDLGNLLDSKPVNYNQSRAEYGDIAVLQTDEYPYSAYLAGELDEFSIELNIEGGVFDGMTQSVKWPGEYTLPTLLPIEGGNAGNENNAGSGFEEIEEDSINTGQHPNIPQEPDSPSNGEYEPPSDKEYESPSDKKTQSSSDKVPKVSLDKKPDLPSDKKSGGEADRNDTAPVTSASALEKKQSPEPKEQQLTSAMEEGESGSKWGVVMVGVLAVVLLGCGTMLVKRLGRILR